MKPFLELLRDIWNTAIISSDKGSFTLGKLATILFSLILLFVITAVIKKFLVKKLFPKYNINVGVAEAIGSLFRYSLITLGFIVIIQASGIDLSTLGLLIGALGIGIGFGLQNITNNFISGLIILFERPIKVGDRVEVGNIAGNVVEISARATTILTNDNIAIIVPNSEFINQRVINWSLENRMVRLNFPVGVAYKENPEKVKQVLLEVALSHDGILKNPPPDVLFDSFGDSSLQFNLRVWTDSYSDRPKVLKSQLYYAIFEKFRQHNIEIPFPQRDIHIKEMPIQNR